MLQIDAEGSDDRILLSTDFSNICPEFIRFEHCHMSTAALRSVVQHLRKFGYVGTQDKFKFSSEAGVLDTLMKRVSV